MADQRFNLPSDLGDEAKKFRELVEKGSNRTVSGAVVFTSNTSQNVYTSSNGEQGLFTILGEALSAYNINEDFINFILGEVSASVESTTAAVERIDDHIEDRAYPHGYLDEGIDPDFAGVIYRLVIIDGEPFLQVMEVPQ